VDLQASDGRTSKTQEAQSRHYWRQSLWVLLRLDALQWACWDFEKSALRSEENHKELPFLLQVLKTFRG